MHRYTLITATILTAVGVPALADVTAADVWADFKAYSEMNGQTLTAASETMSGDTLTATGVAIAMELPEGELISEIGDIAFKERGDGTVEIIVPESYNIVMSGTTEEGETGEATITVAHNGLSTIASGSAEETTYDFTAPTLTVAIDSLMAEGEAVPINLVATFSNLTGKSIITDGETLGVSSDYNVANLSVSLAVTSPEGDDGTVDMTLEMADLSAVAEGTISSFNAMSGLGDMVERGMSTVSTFSFGATTMDMSGNSDGQDFAATASASGGKGNASITEDGLAYEFEENDVAMSVSGSQVPLPDVSFTMDRAAWKFAMPILVSEEPGDIDLALRLEGLGVSDMLWSLADPTGALPHDPATLVVDLSGKGNWFIDITDPTLADAAIEEIPGEIQALTVNELLLSIAGAELSGTGDFAINNDTMPPTPAGKLNLQLVGANTLMDTLTEMGLLPQDQAMGARMMLGLFARPGDGEDTLVSEIEMTPDGGIIANGQQLR